MNISTFRVASVWAKQSVGTRNLRVGIRNAAVTRWIAAVFSLIDGSSVVADNNVNPTWSITPSIQMFEDGWCRIQIGGVLNSGGAVENSTMRISLCDGVNETYNGDNTSAILLWRAMYGQP